MEKFKNYFKFPLYMWEDFDLKVFIVVSILFMIVYISKNIFDFIKNKYLIIPYLLELIIITY